MSIAYNPTIVTDGLVLALDPANIKSYSGSGTTINDLSTNGFVATTSNSPTYTNGYFSFNGTNQYYTVPYSSILSPTAGVTVSAWAYNTNWNTSSDIKIVSKTQGGGWQLSINDPGFVGEVGFTIHLGGTYRPVGYNRALVGAGWHHLVGTCDGRYVRFYLDGVERDVYDNTSTVSLTYGINTQLAIGAEPDGASIVGNYWNGSVGPVIVYNRALAAVEVQQNFNALRGRYGI